MLENVEDMEIKEDNQNFVPIVGEFYALALRKTYQIGQALQLNPEAETARFLMMKKAGPGGVSLSWPPVEKFQDTEYSKIIIKVSAPRYIDDKKTYRLSDDDIIAVRLCLE